MKTVRWGLLGAGNILNRWMNGFSQLDNCEIVAISSRTQESAKLKAEKFNIQRILSYEDLVKCDDIDVCYVNTIHPAHKELSIMAMNAGKSVLVEKPGAVNPDDFREMVSCAKKNNVFLMEAVWTRFFPMWSEVKKAIADNEIGDIRLLESAFSFKMQAEDKSSRLFDPKQAGGAILDVGVYNLIFSNIIMDKNPTFLTKTSAINTDENKFGVDETTAMVAKYDNGVISQMTCGIRGNMPETGYIFGSEGYIEIPHFYKPEIAIVHKDNGTTRTIESKVPQKVPGIVDEGYQFEIEYVNNAIRNGIKEPQIATWENTIEILDEAINDRR